VRDNVRDFKFYGCYSGASTVEDAVKYVNSFDEISWEEKEIIDILCKFFKNFNTSLLCFFDTVS